ncbi:MAG: glycosyltransferase family 4 protein [Candidatus Omnitrophica bacterium]|nr:glycosyltransferase family 4 protein [Candidatus Omnitrophota bacterium]MCF7876710.1 glycosyltransferase family 4 protein [Candidatus Omnitrophota bacterium]MCF7878960.1 glycosyltransferase family 4 protein [Candidatus Omnitrophota bacterium]MCF7891443.1 glycosyltransferase family 4 protein [Candidatus Omnitrophota bacterium]MCF7895379.1 glycosyltransferase family 4 protein [Candidatus Omnitrophota bacterium]
MKIAIIGTRGITSQYSGIEKSLKETALRLANRGHLIHAYCQNNHNYFQKINHKNIKLIYLPALKNRYLETCSHTVLSLLHLLFFNFNVDIVHIHALGPALFSFLPKIFNKKVVVTVHGLDWQRKKWGIVPKIVLKIGEYAAGYFPDRTIVVSKNLKSYFHDKFKKSFFYIPNGTNIPVIGNSPLKKEKKYILFVGRLTPEKEIDLLIRAFNQLNTNLKLVIAGTASYYKKYFLNLKRIAGPKIEFPGFIKEKALDGLYRNAYLFILPSSIEGSPLSLLEAMSYGLCVLTSKIKENQEIVENSGILFESGNCTDLKNKLKYLINNPGLVENLGKKARQKVKLEYNWEKIITNLENLYQELGANEKN